MEVTITRGEREYEAGDESGKIEGFVIPFVEQLRAQYVAAGITDEATAIEDLLTDLLVYAARKEGESVDALAARAARAASGELDAAGYAPVHCIAFRHKTPGEGVGGVQWDTEPDRLREYIATLGIFDDGDYETVTFTHTTAATDRDAITDEVDAVAWATDWDKLR